MYLLPSNLGQALAHQNAPTQTHRRVFRCHECETLKGADVYSLQEDMVLSVLSFCFTTTEMDIRP